MVILNNMKKLVDTLHIDPRKEYSLRDIAELKLIPWATNYRTLVLLIEKGLRGWDKKESRVIIDGDNKKYIIKGSAIRKYIINYGPALMGTVRKSKKNGRTIKR